MKLAWGAHETLLEKFPLETLLGDIYWGNQVEILLILELTWGNISHYDGKELHLEETSQLLIEF